MTRTSSAMELTSNSWKWDILCRPGFNLPVLLTHHATTVQSLPSKLTLPLQQLSPCRKKVQDDKVFCVARNVLGTKAAGGVQTGRLMKKHFGGAAG